MGWWIVNGKKIGFTFSLPAEFCWCCTVCSPGSFSLFPILMRLNFKGKKGMADWAKVVYLFVSSLFDFFFRFCMGCFHNEKSDEVCRLHFYWALRAIPLKWRTAEIAVGGMERTEGKKKDCVIVSHCNESGEHFIIHAQTLPPHWMMGV